MDLPHQGICRSGNDRASKISLRLHHEYCTICSPAARCSGPVDNAVRSINHASHVSDSINVFGEGMEYGLTPNFAGLFWSCQHEYCPAAIRFAIRTVATFRVGPVESTFTATHSHASRSYACIFETADYSLCLLYTSDAADE